MIKPNLFIIGAMKCGTSSLHEYLNAHPEIFMCEPKEPCYFVHPDQLNWPDIKKLKFWESEERYLELFKAGDSANIIGESSTLYTKAPGISDVPDRIYQFNPSARFIYIVRDPIERTISHYWHEVRRGNEFGDMLTGVRQNPIYRDVSHYAMQLKLYINKFGQQQIFSLVFEDLIKNPQEVLFKVFDWLGVNPSFTPSNINTRYHTTPKIFYQKAKLYRLRYSWPWNHLISLLPKSLRSLGLKSLVKQVDRDLSEPQIGDVIKYLRPIQRVQTEELSDLLGRKFPEWTLLDSD